MPADHPPGAEADAAPWTAPLKIDWDRQLVLADSDSAGGAADGTGHHVTREDAGRALADFINRRSEGALLVVGRRGSGKTSSVIDAANRAARRSAGKDTAIMPILIRATSLDAEETRPGRALLQGLIWALHARVKSDDGMDGDIRRQAEDLYQNATAAEQSTETLRSEMQTRRLSANVIPIVASTMIAACLAPGAWALQDTLHPAWMVVPAALLLPTFRFWWDKRTTASSTRHRRHVYGLADMQHDFESLLRSLGRRRKIVFILDEFDKADNFYDTIKPLKMLLNQGSALYVIITAPDHAREAMERRSAEHTLFSEILFIKRPLFSEMDRFLDDILDSAGGAETAAAGAPYEDFKLCMRYKSKTDFFSLYGALRDRRVDADGEGRPLVRIALDDAEKTEANLQRAIEAIYSRKAYGAQSMQVVNDEMLDAMYAVAAMAQGMHGSTITLKNVTSALDEDDNRGPGVSAARDLILLLARQGYLKAEDDESYRVIGRLATFAAGGMFAEEEREFVRTYDGMVGALVNFANVQSSLVDEGAAPYSLDTADSRLDDMANAVESVVRVGASEAERQCRASLRLQSLSVTDPDKLRAYTGNARSMLGELRRYAVDLLSGVLEKNGFEMDVSGTIGDDVRTLSFAEGEDVRNSVWRHPDNDNDTKSAAAVAIVHVRDTALLSKMHREAKKLRRPAREIIVALLDDADLQGVQRATIAVGPGWAADDGPAGPDALETAKKRGTYVLAARSPPDVETAEMLVNAVKMIAEHIESGRGGSFPEFWKRLLAATRRLPAARDRASWSPPPPPSVPRGLW